MATVRQATEETGTFEVREQEFLVSLGIHSSANRKEFIRALREYEQFMYTNGQPCPVLSWRRMRGMIAKASGESIVKELPASQGNHSRDDRIGRKTKRAFAKPAYVRKRFRWQL